MMKKEVCVEKCMDMIESLENKNGDRYYFDTICTMKKEGLRDKALEDKVNSYLLDYDYCTMFMTF